MKKIITISMLLAAALSTAAQGNQKIIYDREWSLKSYLKVTHPDFSYDGKVLLYRSEWLQDGSTEGLIFYNEEFDKQREYSFPSNLVTGYSQVFEPEITYNVEQEGEDEVRLVHGGPMSVEEARAFIARWGESILNEVTTSEGTYFYTSYLFYDADDEQEGVVTRSRSENKSGAQSYEYPDIWFWLTTDGDLMLVERNYRVTGVVGDNYVEGRKNYYETNEDYLPVYFRDYDAPYDIEAEADITQTLFNDDARFEYIRPVVTDDLRYIYSGYKTIYKNGFSVEIPYIEKAYGDCRRGFQVMSEDGTVLQTVNFDGNFIMTTERGASLLRIHGRLYLEFSGYVLDEANNSSRYAWLLYELDRETSQIRKVMEHVGGIKVSPRVADRSEQITVELTDEGGIREIQVVDGSGKTAVRVPVARGQKRVSIPASQLSRGMNVVNALGGGSRQAHKVIVK